MTLLELLVKELPGRGGWPKGASFSMQDIDKEVKFIKGAFEFSYCRHKYGLWGAKTPNAWLVNYFFIADICSDFSVSTITREQYETAIASRKQVWNGDGLPPVGVECESAQPGQINWRKFKVVAVELGSVFGFWGNGTSSALDGDKWIFRPLRTEADRNRQDAVDIIRSIIHQNYSGSPDDFRAEEIYDTIATGKIPGVELKK